MLTADNVITEVRAAAERVANQMIKGHHNNDHVQFCRGALGFAEAIVAWYDSELKKTGDVPKLNGVNAENRSADE